MIEISHQQARRWIREHLDHRLPDGQWAALQAHLETCRECSTYLNELEGVQKNLQRALRAGMESLPEPGADLTRQVLDARQARGVQHKRMVLAGLGVAALAVFFLLGGFSGITRLFSLRGDTALAADSAAAQTRQALTPGAPVTGGEFNVTPLPTAGPGDFPDVVLYEGRVGGQPKGKRQIYLLNPGAGPVDLGDEKSNDYSPAWSPDGEWVAFLSDRGGKDEVFVTSLAGSKVVQLSDNSGVSWEGPLSWSADGQWLALSGVRNTQGGQRWVYLVALDGTGARPLPGSRGGSLPKFAPSGDRLAYTFSDGTHSGITIAHVETGEYASTSWLENPLAPPLAEGSGLDWSANGSELVFIAPQPAQVAATNGVTPSDGSVGSQVMAIRDLGSSINLYFDYTNNERVAESRWPGAFRGASWTPFGGVLYLEDLGDARANHQPARPGGCWSLQSQSPFNRGRNSSIQTLSDLCVEGGLDRGSWTPDGRWLVVSGRMPGEASRSLYAIRMPGRGLGGRNTYDGGRSSNQAATPFPTLPPGGPNPSQTVSVLRLAEAPWLGDLPRVRPRLRSYSRPLDINPQAIRPARTELKPSDLAQRPGGPTGQLVYVVQNNTTSVVVRANPDGTGGKVLASTPGENRCPRWSADGQWIALVSQQGSLASVAGGGRLEKPLPVLTTLPTLPALGEAIFLMDADGGSVRQLTRSDRLPGADPSAAYTFDCPAWSPMDAPGGPYIAATLQRAGSWYLTLARLNAGPDDPDAVRYLQIGRPSPWAAPAWSTDGRSLYLALNIDAGNLVRLLRVSLPDDPQGSLTSQVVYEEASASVNGLLVDPNGRVVYALTQSDRDSGESLARLVNTNLRYSSTRRYLLLGKDFPRYPIHSGALAQLGGDSVGYILRGSPLDLHQATINRIGLRSGLYSTLAVVDDVVNEAAWSPDGRYVIFSTESGLWGLDIQSAQQGQAGPVWLSPQPMEDMDWR